MKPILKQALMGGMVGTALMTIAMLPTPLLVLPYRSTPSMLADMLDVPLGIGWLMHFVMGSSLPLLMLSCFSTGKKA